MAVKPRRGADPCQAIRERLAEVFQQIVETRLDLTDPDIPASIKQHLRAVLRELLKVQAALRDELVKCRAGARKAMSAKKTMRKPDPCQPLRDQLDRLDQEIQNIRDALSDPDIPEIIKRRLRPLLQRLLQTRGRLLQLLKECEAKHRG